MKVTGVDVFLDAGSESPHMMSVKMLPCEQKTVFIT